MITTLVITSWLVAFYYGVRAGGPRGVVQALRNPEVPFGWKIALVFCLLPVPGPLDNMVAALILRRLAQQNA